MIDPKAYLKEKQRRKEYYEENKNYFRRKALLRYYKKKQEKQVLLVKFLVFSQFKKMILHTNTIQIDPVIEYKITMD